MIKKFCIIIAISFVITGIAYAQLQESVPPIHRQAKASNEHQKCAKQPQDDICNLSSPINITVGGKVGTHRKDAKEGGDAESSKWTDPITWFTCLLVIFTGGLWYSTHKLWGASKEQSIDMKKSLAIARESANATNNIVSTMENNARKQMRAYLSVNIDTGIYQDDRFFFEVKPSLKNTGFTPAYKISYWANADIFDSPLPEGFILPYSEEILIPRDTALAPHHGFQLSAIVKRRLDDIEAENVKLGNGKKVYIWGKVEYIDIFGDSHYTNFFHGISWLVNTINNMTAVVGHYENTHNDAD